MIEILFLAPDRPGAVAVAAGGAIVLGVLLLRRERKQFAPVWPVDLLTLRPIRVAVVASISCFAGQSAGLLALAFHLQWSTGHGPLTAGLVMACWPLSVAAIAPVASRLAVRFGSALLCAAGGGMIGLGLLLCALWPAQASPGPLAAGAALAGLGFGLFQVPNNRTLFLTAPPERSAAAGGLQGSARLIGQTLGSLLIGVLYAFAASSMAPRAGLAFAAVFAIIAAGASALELPMSTRAGRNSRRQPATITR